LACHSQQNKGKGLSQEPAGLPAGTNAIILLEGKMGRLKPAIASLLAGLWLWLAYSQQDGTPQRAII